MNKYTKDLEKVVSPKFNEPLLMQIVQKMFYLRHVTITDITFQFDSKKGDSYLSTVTKFTVKATGKDERNGGSKDIILPVISKALPANNARRQVFRSLDFFKNEEIFYNKVWKTMNEFQFSKSLHGVFTNIPQCVSAFSDGAHDYLILDDLSLKDYVGIARCRGLDLNHARLIMKLFAKFHALSLAFKDQNSKKFEDVANYLEETYFAEKYRAWYAPFQTQNLYPVVHDAVKKQLPTHYLDKLEKLFLGDFYGTLIRHCSEKGPLTVITHGDAWIPNFLIKYNNKQVPLEGFMIDFQLARYASLALDITFFLYSCTEQALRLKHWDNLILDYHTTFTETLEKLGSSKDLLTLDALKSEIKKHALFGIGMSMEAVTMSLLEDDETADLDMIQGDQLGLECVWVLHPFEDEEKRQRMADMFKHAVDHDFI